MLHAAATVLNSYVDYTRGSVNGVRPALHLERNKHIRIARYHLTCIYHVIYIAGHGQGSNKIPIYDQHRLITFVISSLLIQITVPLLLLSL